MVLHCPQCLRGEGGAGGDPRASANRPSVAIRSGKRASQMAEQLAADQRRERARRSGPRQTADGVSARVRGPQARQVALAGAVSPAIKSVVSSLASGRICPRSPCIAGQRRGSPPRSRRYPARQPLLGREPPRTGTGSVASRNQPGTQGGKRPTASTGNRCPQRRSLCRSCGSSISLMTTRGTRMAARFMFSRNSTSSGSQSPRPANRRPGPLFPAKP